MPGSACFSTTLFNVTVNLLRTYSISRTPKSKESYTVMLNFQGPSWCWEILWGIINKFPLVEPPTFLARSNYVPNPQEHVTIQELVHSNEVAIRDLEAVITEMQLAHSILKSRLADYKKCKEFHSALLSPVRKLPDEILGHIFSYTCVYGIDIASGPKPGGGIWDIQSVCIRWRNVAQNTPNLWKDFKAQWGSSIIPTHSSIIRRIQTCLTHSGTLPLTICLDLDSFPMQTLVEISDHSDRWESFTSNGEVIEQIWDTGAASVIQKRGLALLHSITVNLEPDTLNSYSIFNLATSLTEFSLRHSVLPDVEDFPWSRINELELTQCWTNSEYEIAPIFQAMTSLEKLVWIGNTFRESPTQSIVLPSLHTLAVVNDGWEDFDEQDGLLPLKLPLFRAPRLSNVRILGLVIQMQDLIAVVRNSGDSFNNLFLSRTSEELALQAIKEFSYVTELTLNLARDDLRSILEKLTSSPGSKEMQMLPSLRRLHIPFLLNYQDRPISLLMDFMRSRSPHSAELTSQGKNIHTSSLCYVSVSGDDSNDPAISQLRDLGKELSITVDISV